MPLVYEGSATLGVALPTPLAAVNATGLQVQGMADAAASAAVSFNPGSIAESITIAEQILASLQAAAVLGIEPPSVSLQLDISAALKASVVLLGQLSGFFAAAGVHFWAYSGPASGFGSTLQGALASGVPSGGGAASALVGVALAAEVSASPEAVEALKFVFGVDP